MIPVISPNYFMQKASYMQAKLIADTISYDGSSDDVLSFTNHSPLRRLFGMLPDTGSYRIGHPLFMRVTSAVVQGSRSDQDAISKRRSFQSFFADHNTGNRVPGVGENHFQIQLVRLLSQKHDQRLVVINITANIRVQNNRLGTHRFTSFSFRF